MQTSADIQLFRPESLDTRKKYENLCVEWCKWLLSIPKQKSPAFDIDGSFATINQNTEVFFLCQTYEASKPIPNRQVTVPFGCKIFLPIINWISFKDHIHQTDEDLRLLAKEKMDAVGKLQFYVNGRLIADSWSTSRIQSPVFDMYLPPDNILSADVGNCRIATDGYWVFFKPLAKKVHITSCGACSLGVTEISVNYTILCV
jgi:hypothetical protein